MKTVIFRFAALLLLILPAAACRSFAQDTLNRLTAKEKQQGWRLLFDGKTSSGWVGAGQKTFPAKPNGWIIQDGMLTVQGSGKGEASSAGDIVTTEEFGAFDLVFDFRLTTGANSGLKYFVTVPKEKGAAIGLEYQLLDDAVHPDAKMGRDGNRTLASLYDLITGQKPAASVHPIGEWNRGRIVVYPDNRVEHYLNGFKVLEYVRKSPGYRNLVKLSKYKDYPNFGEANKGPLLLQDHGHTVNFRNMKIRML